MKEESARKGIDKLTERHMKYGDPRTGKKLTAEEAREKSRKIVERTEKKQADR